MMRTTLLALALLLPLQADAHDEYTGLRNPATKDLCCGKDDCKPVAAEDVIVGRESYYYNGMVIARREALPSFDDKYHVCTRPLPWLNRALRCILVPRIPGS